MNNKNGIKITLWIFGVVIFPVLFFIGGQLIATDKEARSRDTRIETESRDRDDVLQQKFYDKVEEIKKEQSQKFEQMIIAITKLETTIDNR